MFRVKARRGNFRAVEIGVADIAIEVVFCDQRSPGHLPAACHGSEQFQERDCARRRGFHVSRESIQQPVCRLCEFGHALRQRYPDHVQGGMSRFCQIRVHAAHLRQHQLDGGAFLVSDLASKQVVGLDAGGAFVYGRYARIAQILRGTGFLDITHAAMNLHAGGCNFDALLGTPALDHRRQ